MKYGFLVTGESKLSQVAAALAFMARFSGLKGSKICVLGYDSYNNPFAHSIPLEAFSCGSWGEILSRSDVIMVFSDGNPEGEEAKKMAVETRKLAVVMKTMDEAIHSELYLDGGLVGTILLTIDDIGYLLAKWINGAGARP